MDIHIDSQSFINETTGEVVSPAEYHDKLRLLERQVGRYDMVIVTLKGDLKAAKVARDKTIAELRYAVSEAKVLFGKSSRVGRNVPALAFQVAPDRIVFVEEERAIRLVVIEARP